MAREFGPALGVSTADFNGDGWIDIYVANDGAAEPAVDQPARRHVQEHGAAVGRGARAPTAKPKASMGVDAGDFDNDGDEDLFVTELAGEGHDLYVNDGSGVFEERSARAGIRLPSLPYTGFGAAWFDFDNDGWLDILTVNGAVSRRSRRSRGTIRFRCSSAKQLFRNLGNGQFEDVTDAGRRGLAESRGRPRRRVRRHRQRRRHRRRGGQRQRPAPAARSTTSATAITGWA